MFFVGLDLSLTHTGIAIMEDGDIFDSGEIANNYRGMERLSYLRTRIQDRLALNTDRKFEIVAIEGYSYASVGQAIYQIGELGGIVRLLLYDKNIPILIVPPSIVKQFVGASGNAKKCKVVEMYNMIYHTSFKERDNNIVDALILAKIARVYTIDKNNWIIEKCQQI